MHRALTLPASLAALLAPLGAALQGGGAAVLSAPPGLGKTTLVPLALLDAPWLRGQRIVMLEPRRLAARAAAARMAALRGEAVGETVGYRVRFDARVGPGTRIEVVTEGLLARRLQGDPELRGVGLLIFDEFHERHLASDLALALALDARSALRNDLALLVMSATLDCARIAELLGNVPVLRAEARLHEVTVEHVGGPASPAALGAAVRQRLAEPGRDVLVFLPGVAEIRRTAALLAGAGAEVVALHGGLDRDAQDRAIAPAATRRVVLATNIAETSLTIEGVDTVIDSGLARVPRFDPGSGLSRLRTEPISQAAAAQRAGRAGRLGPGRCIRLWTPAEQQRRAAFADAEILHADLAALLLDVALWGVNDVAELRWLDPPPAGSVAQAQAVLRLLGALDGQGRVTTRGRAMAGLGVHPRLAAMLVAAAGGGAAALACQLAALLEEGNPWRGPAAQRPVDVEACLRPLEGDLGAATADVTLSRSALQRIRRAAAELQRRLRSVPGAGGAGWRPAPGETGRLLARAYPDRISRQRAFGRFVLAGGRAVTLSAVDPLAGSAWLVAAEVEAGLQEGRIHLAAALPEAALREAGEALWREADVVRWDDASAAVVARREVRIGELLVSTATLPGVSAAAQLDALLEGVRRMGLGCLPWNAALRQWQARVQALRAWTPGEGLPDLGDEALLARLEEWLGPFLHGCSRRAHLARVDLAGALRAQLDRSSAARLDAGAPPTLDLPAGGVGHLDYTACTALQGPLLAVPLQAVFGLHETPRVAWGRVPVTLQLLSPARRPLQITQDLASFWREAYPQVRKEMRGRYPKHVWPQDPASAAPMRGSVKQRRRR